MKKLNRQFVGILLVIGVILCGVAYQVFGPGLITSDTPATPPELLAQGITLTNRTVYHYTLFPFVAFGIAGLVMALIPKRDAARH